MSDFEFSEKSPLLHKISSTSYNKNLPREISTKHLKVKKESTSRNPYTFNNISRTSSVNSISDLDSSVASLNDAAQYNRYLYYTKLHNFSGSQLVIPDHVLPRQCFWPIRGREGEKQSSIITIFAIWNTMMGTSLLSMPWAIQQSGFVLGVGLIVLMAFICLFTCLLVVKSADKLIDRSSVEFVDVCQTYLGTPGKVICFVFASLAFVGAVIVYWVLMSNFLYNVGAYIYDHATVHRNHMDAISTVTDSFHGAYCPSKDQHLNVTKPSEEHVVFYKYWNQRRTVPFFLFFLLTPLSSLKSPTFFTKFNALGTFSVLYIIVFIIVKAVQWGPHLQFTDKSLAGYAHVVDVAFPSLTGVLGLALYIHAAILSILATNEKPENNSRDVSLAYLFTTLTYAFVGIVFVAFFPHDKSCIQQVFLNNFVQSDMMTFAAQCGLLFQMTTVFPLLMYILRVQIFSVLYNKVDVGYPGIVCLNCCIISLAVLMAVFYPEVGDIIRYVGSVSALVLIFTLPAVVTMVIKNQNGDLASLDAICYAGLILIGLLNLVGQFVV